MFSNFPTCIPNWVLRVMLSNGQRATSNIYDGYCVMTTVHDFLYINYILLHILSNALLPYEHLRPYIHGVLALIDAAAT